MFDIEGAKETNCNRKRSVGCARVYWSSLTMPRNTD